MAVSGRDADQNENSSCQTPMPKLPGSVHDVPAENVLMEKVIGKAKEVHAEQALGDSEPASLLVTGQLVNKQEKDVHPKSDLINRKEDDHGGLIGPSVPTEQKNTTIDQNAQSNGDDVAIKTLYIRTSASQNQDCKEEMSENLVKEETLCNTRECLVVANAACQQVLGNDEEKKSKNKKMQVDLSDECITKDECNSPPAKRPPGSDQTKIEPKTKVDVENSLKQCRLKKFHKDPGCEKKKGKTSTEKETPKHWMTWIVVGRHWDLYWLAMAVSRCVIGIAVTFLSLAVVRELTCHMTQTFIQDALRSIVLLKLATIVLPHIKGIFPRKRLSRKTTEALSPLYIRGIGLGGSPKTEDIPKIAGSKISELSSFKMQKKLGLLSNLPKQNLEVLCYPLYQILKDHNYCYNGDKEKELDQFLAAVQMAKGLGEQGQDSVHCIILNNNFDPCNLVISEESMEEETKRKAEKTSLKHKMRAGLTGSYGKVEVLWDERARHFVAVKMIELKKFHPNEVSVPCKLLWESKKARKYEAAKHIPEIYAVSCGKGIVRIFQEYISNDLEPSVFMMNNGGKPPNDNVILGILQQGLQTLCMLQECRVCHADIKPQNMGYVDGQLHIMDWGLCARIDQLTKKVTGTAFYLAPEIWKGGNLQRTPKSDVFSLALAVISIIKGEHVWAKLCKDKTSVQQIAAHVLNNTDDLLGVVDGLSCPDMVKTVLVGMLKYNPWERLSASQALDIICKRTGVPSLSIPTTVASTIMYPPSLSSPACGRGVNQYLSDQAAGLGCSHSQTAATHTSGQNVQSTQSSPAATPHVIQLPTSVTPQDIISILKLPAGSLVPSSEAKHPAIEARGESNIGKGDERSCSSSLEIGYFE